MTDYTIYVRQVYNGPIEVGDKGENHYALRFRASGVALQIRVIKVNPLCLFNCCEDAHEVFMHQALSFFFLFLGISLNAQICVL
uniref:Uncharacterized protein n=1 Tax=Setaria italica TaxID=4555 RepID=K4AHD4_SETIT